MSPTSPPLESRTLAFLGALFILLFFVFFTYSGLFAYFTFDDGTTVIYCLKPFETTWWRDLLHILTVFTTAFRPLTTMFWRPLYAVFGFNPLPYRIAEHVLLAVNIGLAYLLARRLEVTREGAALTALFFCYNAAMAVLYYNTCLVGDVMCFSLYSLAMILYLRGRQGGEPLTWRRIAGVAVCYLLALDSKELAVTLPGILVIYELLYRLRDFRDRRKALRVGGVLAVMFVVGAIYLKVKVAEMGQNSAYHPTVTVGFIVNNIGHYLQELFYLPENSVTPAKSGLILGGLVAAGALVRSRQAIFGVLYFVTSLIPVAVIASRGSYAAYVSYFGLALAVGAILAGARSQLTRFAKRTDLETASAVVLFVCTAVLVGRAHMVRRVDTNGYFEWDKPKLVTLMNDFRRTIPEFPPNARVLITDDVWDPDWGLMFLVRLMYNDKTVWVDRPNTMGHAPDLPSYDLVISYKAPDIELSPAIFHGFPMKWEIRGRAINSGQFVVSSPAAHGAASRVEFSPEAVKSNRKITVSVPGLSNVAINALYRIVSQKGSTPHLVENWCTLDGNGNCTIYAPSEGGPVSIVVDWIQPVGQRWIFTNGVLSVLE